MARHAASKNKRRALLRTGLTVAAAGAALGAGSAAAQAAPAPALPVALPTGPVGAESVAGAGQTGALTGPVTNSVSGIGQLKRLQLDPLANTGVDPLNNAVGMQVADFKPVSSAMVTDQVTKGQAIADLPVVGPLVGGLLPG
ncbi:hypothetical protein ABZ208_18000 [Streptomyces sp. NPDC006208]|uniref:hypothetical protein n=1 Tax=Streptomyces sp. NPDC006208 TaxID=3156734 RepID=UPI0033A2BA67